MSGPCALYVGPAGAQRGHLVGLLEAEGLRVDLALDGRSTMQRLQRRPRPVLILVALEGAAEDVASVARMLGEDPTLADVPVVAVAPGGSLAPGSPSYAELLVVPVGSDALAACLDRLLGSQGADPLGPVRRSLRALIQAEGSLEVSLQEALDTLDSMTGKPAPHDAPLPSASDGHKA